MISELISSFEIRFAECTRWTPWHFVRELPAIVTQLIGQLGDDYRVNGNVAIHKQAIVEAGAIIKGPVVVSEGCFIASHAYIRGGVFLANRVVVGPGCELKTSAVFEQSTLAHFNFVGDSLIGGHVNMEAGSILANYHNERADRTIYVRSRNGVQAIDVEKFGSVVGDNVKIGANAVCSPGTVLTPGTIVRRLQLVEQVPDGDR